MRFCSAKDPIFHEFGAIQAQSTAPFPILFYSTRNWVCMIISAEL